MKVKRIVANVSAPAPDRAKHFYQELLGLEVLMDMGWIVTYGSRAATTVQISIMAEGGSGGSGAPVPDLSIEVDDLEAALARVRKAKIPIEYGPVDEPWGVRRFFVRDPFGKLVNILIHA
jgi:catechol 2,3-dioxygenase-like lactoylglutathione lyase family enzyme